MPATTVPSSRSLRPSAGCRSDAGGVPDTTRTEGEHVKEVRNSVGVGAAGEPADPDTLRARVDELLQRLPPGSTEPSVFLRAQYEAGLAWVHYPPGYGGAGASMELQQAVDDRLAAAKAPPSGRVFNAIGAGQCAATVLQYGSEAQKQRYLPKVFTGEAEWCQLFSEPGSGSDLASL